MQTTQQEKDRLRTIITQAVDGNATWLGEKNIWCGDKSGHYVLNYGIGPRNEYNRLVRGMVVRQPTDKFNDPLTLVRSFPFTRFFNHGEGDAATINWSNAEMIEKMDGTMVGVFFDENGPRWHTRRMLSGHGPDEELTLTGFHGGSARLLPLIGEFVNKLNWSGNEEGMTYVFEFIHEVTFVWTKYQSDDYGLYLLGARNVLSHVELTEAELDREAERLGCQRPRRWDSMNDHDAIMKKMKEICEDTPDFEGFVFRCRETGNRLKVKDPDYVKWHHMLDKLSFRRLIPLVAEGESEEIVAYFPLAKERVDVIQKKWNDYEDYVIRQCLG